MLPPYGFFGGHYRVWGESNRRVMLDWKPHLEQDERLDTFNAWRDKQISVLSELVWPTYEVSTGKWIGGAEAFAEAMTEQELEIIISEFLSGAGELSKRPNTAISSDGILTHLEQFAIEDDVCGKYGLGYALEQYDSTLSPEELQDAKAIIKQAFSVGQGPGHKVTGLFWFKGQFLRPRPYQTAMIFGKEHFYTQIAQTALHSAMMSGHCLQGMLIGCSVLEYWLDCGLAISKDRLQALSQYAVDFGDRRVFAGVHYPTDNIASWGIVLSLIPHIFRHNDAISKFAVDAISNNSRVYSVVDQNFRGKPEFDGAMTFLDTSFNNAIGLTS